MARVIVRESRSVPPLPRTARARSGWWPTAETPISGGRARGFEDKHVAGRTRMQRQREDVHVGVGVAALEEHEVAAGGPLREFLDFANGAAYRHVRRPVRPRRRIASQPSSATPANVRHGFRRASPSALQSARPRPEAACPAG